MWFDCALDWMWERMSGWTNTRVFGTLDFMPLLSARQTSSSALSLSVRSLACLPFNQRIVVSYTHLLSAFIINMATSAQHSRPLSLSFSLSHHLILFTHTCTFGYHHLQCMNVTFWLGMKNIYGFIWLGIISLWREFYARERSVWNDENLRSMSKSDFMSSRMWYDKD